MTDRSAIYRSPYSSAYQVLLPHTIRQYTYAASPLHHFTGLYIDCAHKYSVSALPPNA